MLRKRYFIRSKRQFFFLVIDIALALFSYWVAYLLRFDGFVPRKDFELFTRMLPFIVVLRVPCFIYFGLYRTLWQYLGIQELFSIIKATTASSVLLAFSCFAFGFRSHPRSVFIIDWLILTVSLSSLRVLFRILIGWIRNRTAVSAKRVLIVGAEDTGELLVREFLKRPELGYKPIGFLDDDSRKLGGHIHGIRIAGGISQLAHVIRAKRAEEVILALAKVSGAEIKEVLKRCRELRVACRIIPQAFFLHPPHLLPLKLRPVNVSDLLGRELVEADLSGVEDFFSGKSVLITGAGGSIGSELTRMVVKNHPREVILVDHSENNLYEISSDLSKNPSETEVSQYLCDVTNEKEIEKIFVRHEPEVVYHAAAFKHVPLMEVHFREGIINNVFGTKIVADFALKYNAERFVLISTDKAIHPQSVMGATKRIAELYTQVLSNGKTHFLTVRFGNVFNSRGSVVSVFQKQIEEGEPLTITHPEAKRYFMDVSEAVFLILKATIIGSNSEIFILDMGKSVRILDLAYDLAQFMGVPFEGVQIKYIGLRAGEKLEENLEVIAEQALNTIHQKIRVWKSKDNSSVDIREHVDELIHLAQTGGPRDAILQKLIQVVPEYTPWDSASGSLGERSTTLVSNPMFET
ncbi:MAG: polysaccharide biosynthesis protein [Candidatus Omnitrophica bacterium]|nr:polysaccharide biosynthesis protein [Candidatus Omnitrophota bacterium]